MTPLVLMGSDSLPNVSFHPTEGKLSISGRCIPENALEFFEPLLSWVNNCTGTYPESVTLDICLEYLNSSSVSSVASIVRKLDAMRDSGSSVIINWYHEEDDEDMMDSGMDIKETFNVQLNLVPMPSGDF